jgi:hypothetical protein
MLAHTPQNSLHAGKAWGGHFIKIYTIMHQTQSSQYLIGFRMKNLQDTSLDINRGKSDVMTSYWARSSVHYEAGSRVLEEKNLQVS